ncbi:dethiobiotin synthase [Parashewanella curva]|uniref:ATP-dependent dethiobiotin synthetase BioD n=1 Tax=Parashewanella curva TaxID=2338552 RepID=A0A3L8PT56_9GAMM|nr:dethiobiotin synthase [Parashewanella curva]RLV58575.1 dethiobiotin synthase [Parashewanella curva]
MKFFVTGTDTDSGKTLAASAILVAVNNYARKQNKAISTLGIKPIASGCEQTEKGLRNSDALSLISAMNSEVEYQTVNPIRFEPAIAPHIAAKQVGFDLTADKVEAVFRQIPQADFTLIEGAGGWRLPLNDNEYLSQVVAKQKLPVILVIGMKLGCLNHAMLTHESILAYGLEIVGWVANHVDPDMLQKQENLAFLKQTIKAPFLGEIPFLEDATADVAAKSLDVSVLV